MKRATLRQLDSAIATLDIVSDTEELDGSMRDAIARVYDLFSRLAEAR